MFSGTAQETQRFDGWYNNLVHPSWGSVGEPYRRFQGAGAGQGIRPPFEMQNFFFITLLVLGQVLSVIKSYRNQDRY